MRGDRCNHQIHKPKAIDLLSSHFPQYSAILGVKLTCNRTKLGAQGLYCVCYENLSPYFLFNKWHQFSGAIIRGGDNLH